VAMDWFETIRQVYLVVILVINDRESVDKGNEKKERQEKHVEMMCQTRK